MFSINNLSKVYNGEYALNNVSLNITKGLNFIVGASGSGKSTLLKIITGMEQDFSGDVLISSVDVKTLKQNDKSYLYNNIIGFVWQDFNLIEEQTVLENIQIPLHLKEDNNSKIIQKTLKDLKIFDLSNKKVKLLSGGQKQRVVIARELLKSPEIIIADEPTSALDEKSSAQVMEILRDLAKDKTVIIVTHDTTLIRKNDKVFELDKGELISSPENIKSCVTTADYKIKQKLSVKSAYNIAKTTLKHQSARFFIGSISIVIASLLLLTTFSGAITNNAAAAFDELYRTYGDTFLNINVVGSFISASGTDDNDKNEPQANVNQDISKLYDKFNGDKRVDFMAYTQAFNDIKITFGDKNFSIASSGNVPVLNKLLAGMMPNANGYEVAIPESFATQMGYSNDDVIGKEIIFNASMNNWESGELKVTNGEIKVIIVGVVDTTMIYEYEGEPQRVSIDDSFFFSKTALKDIKKQGEYKKDETSFLIRANNPVDLISLKDELNADGIVPLGRFELVEDLVRLNDTTTKQSSNSSVIIAILAVILAISIFLITAFLRKKEYAIYKISGFNNNHLHLTNIAETIINIVVSTGVFLLTSPLLNLLTKSLFNVDILNPVMLFFGIALIIFVSLITFITTLLIYTKADIKIALKTGDK